MNSKTKWNSKHNERMKKLNKPTANPRLKRLSHYLNGGTALDLACGLGGNSLFLANLGYHVQSIDISDVAIGYLNEQASKYHLTIQPQIADLTDANYFQGKANCFDVVILTYYLDRSLFPLIKQMIKDEGYLFMETFYQTSLIDSQGVSEQYKLQSKELLAVFGDWDVLFFEENEQMGWQSIFCKKRS
ncbi:2-polyprenyl-3-methyl-5-hydroxy-6-metoxy-1,4-benzoquinol methylase [Cytobacillus eiseniae]|uniref:2-polyprenyl-3-methyl-5-hydroxy-6-metoxy-1, 4-benzoquinol methylase n=1 Tax=Cytobacillus eiseniae TaxID=762947 RepID=A0ABS4RAY8_9BACI|nr:methyltransferase domain-containing protein [Cytobacillus eiseniae]MBP2239854.1 2-polyprenyl-3-methyl-5-hydroxy-6-metoxy-1,4-benzoquinol methylase [Cytobacillus eiseniae]